MVVRKQRLSCESLFRDGADLQGLAAIDFDDNSDHSVAGKVCVVQSLARLVEALVAPSFHEFQVWADEVEFGVGNARQDEIFYWLSACIGSFGILRIGLFQNGRVGPIVQCSGSSLL